MKLIIEKNVILKTFVLVTIVFISLLVFASLAEDFVNRETLSIFDPQFGSWLINQTSLSGDYVFSAITFLGNSLIISAGTAIAGFWLAKKKDWNRLMFLFSVVGGSAILNLILKNIFQRARPVFAQAFLVDTGYSFPSGHAMISIAFYGAIAYLLFSMLKSKRNKTLIVVGALIMTVLIGFSRLYLGVHFLTDVLAGWAAGALCLTSCILVEYLLRYSRLYNSKSR
ncbi:MAG: hypothetical protein C0410_01240 [Anaerolinea sp.]|nr:hypothetical protein [Anaerolinea sp.]